MSSSLKVSSYPLVSVVIPIRNEAPFIKECLDGIWSQDYERNLIEIIVVDGMSNDGTRELLSKLPTADNGLAMIDNPLRIFPTGVNLGIRRAKGELVLILGGHAVLPPNYIRECVDCLIKEDVECVGGAVDSVGIGRVAEGIALAMSSRFGVGGSGFRTQGPQATAIPTDTVPFGVFRRRVFERIGLFNEAMVRHQDYEFNYRLRKAGGRILLLPWLRVKYYVRSGFKSLLKQYWQYGIWKGRFLCAYPKSLKSRHIAPPLLVGAMALTASSCFVLKSGVFFTALLVLTYVSFLLYAAVRLSARKHWRLAATITVALASLHFSWGAGLWVGLFRGKIPGRAPEFAG